MSSPATDPAPEAQTLLRRNSRPVVIQRKPSDLFFSTSRSPSGRPPIHTFLKHPTWSTWRVRGLSKISRLISTLKGILIGVMILLSLQNNYLLSHRPSK